MYRTIIYLIYLIILIEGFSGIVLSSYYFVKLKINVFLYLIFVCIFGIVATISRLLMFHPNINYRNFGVQTAYLWIFLFLAGFYLLIKSFDEEFFSFPELAYTFFVIGCLIVSAIFNFWKGVERTPDYYTIATENAELNIILALIGIYYIYVGVHCFSYLYNNLKLSYKKRNKIQVLFLLVSICFFLPISMILQVVESFNIITNGNLLIFIRITRNIFVLIACTLIIFALTIFGRASFPSSIKCVRLMIINWGGVPIYSYRFHSRDILIEEVFLSAALTALSFYYQGLTESDYLIREIEFENYTLLCKFVPENKSEKIPGYTCLLITNSLSMFVKNAFKKFCNRFSTECEQELRKIIGNKLERMNIDAIVNDIFNRLIMI